MKGSFAARLSLALLLVALAPANFSSRISVLHGRIMFVAINLPGEPILLTVEPGAVGRGKLATIVLTHIMRFAVDSSFFSFQVGSFAGCELAALNSIGNAILLVLFALLDRGWLGVAARCLRYRGKHECRDGCS